jgi:hypothetical protein
MGSRLIHTAPLTNLSKVLFDDLVEGWSECAVASSFLVPLNNIDWTIIF